MSYDFISSDGERRRHGDIPVSSSEGTRASWGGDFPGAVKSYGQGRDDEGGCGQERRSGEYAVFNDIGYRKRSEILEGLEDYDVRTTKSSRGEK